MSVSPSEAFFADLTSAIDEWVGGVVAAFSEPESSEAWSEHVDAYRILHNKIGTNSEAVEPIVRELAEGLLHSFLVAIDGGSASADVVRLSLVTDEGLPLGEGLHEMFVEYQVRGGRAHR